MYLDDIIMYGRTLEDHYNKFVEVLKTLREHNLKLKAETLRFVSKYITVYLVHKCTSEARKPDPKKVNYVQNLPRPNTVHKSNFF